MHKPFSVFDEYLAERDRKIMLCLEKRTEEFWRVFSGVSRGEGLMEDDAYILAEFYGIKPPYE
jgi:hypothetical protein